MAIPSNPLDYRPVALTAILCKVFERILAKYILDLTAHLWRDNKQFGFLPGRNTMDAIAQVIEDWSRAKETKQAILAIFFDFAKAFDLVPHDKLLSKLKKYLHPWLISWIAAYLSDRKQRVVFNQTKTEWKPVEAGVLQGSVLGPILFLLFIHDINEIIPEGIELEKYADDILAYIIGDTERIHSNLPQQTIDAINSWCTENGMRLNTTKCKVMTIGNGTIINPMPPLYLNKHALEQVNTYKYLGIEINAQLEWDRQWQLVQRKINTVPYLIKRLKHLGFRQEILVNVYRSHALSHFAYSAPLLTHASSITRAEMDCFQNRNLKIMNLTQSEIEEKFKIPKLETHIDNTCTQILKRIVKDDTHPLTRKLATSKNRKGKVKCAASIARTAHYAKSFVQKYLRTLENGTTDLYSQTKLNIQHSIHTKRMIPQTRLNPPSPIQASREKRNTQEKPLVACTLCGKSYKEGSGIASHMRSCCTKAIN